MRELREGNYLGLVGKVRTLKQCLALAVMAQWDRWGRNLSACYAQDNMVPKFVAVAGGKQINLFGIFTFT